jgi:DNA-binding NarL/FixJ family response regulator
MVKRDRRRAEAVGGDDGERTITLLVIAASATVRAGISALVGADGRFLITGSFASAAEAAQESEVAMPDVALIEFDEELDEEFDELMGLYEEPEARSSAIVALVDNVRTGRALNLLRRGARAVLPRNSTSAEILAALEAVAAGLVVAHPDALDALLEGGRSTKSAGDSAPPGEESQLEIEQLTPREVEVLGMLAEGLGNKEIAWRTKISEHTVKFHVSSIFSKLGVASRTEAVTKGLRRGLIML